MLDKQTLYQQLSSTPVPYPFKVTRWFQCVSNIKLVILLLLLFCCVYVCGGCILCTQICANVYT